MTEDKLIVPIDLVVQSIHLIRGKKVMLDADIAQLYRVETFNLNKAVKRNINRFPDDFMFRLSKEEADNLIFQNGISSGHGGRRSNPFAFTEQGIAMLSSVLRSQRAVEVNIVIMRAFVQMRRMIDGNRELAEKITDLESKYSDHDEKIQMVFAAIRQLMTPVESNKPPIGFK